MKANCTSNSASASTLERCGRAAAAALALGFAAGVAAPAQAADQRKKWYIGANLPVMFIDNTKTRVSGSTTFDPGTGPVTAPYTARGVSSYGLGFRIGGGVGYYVLPNLRVEGELFYGFARVRKTVYSGISVAGNPVPGKVNQPIRGNAKMLGAMANVWYDIDTGTAWRPFVGGGIGIFQADFGGLKWDADRTARAFALPLLCNPQTGGPTPGTQGCAQVLEQVRGVRPKDKDTVFAYQVGGGIGYRWSDTTTFQFGYKFQMAPGMQFGGRNAQASVKTKSDMKIHLFELGFRYRF